MILIPHSNGEDNAPLVEFNPCHGPGDGRFCATATTRVGITSYRGLDKPVPRGVRPAHGADVREFEQALRAIPSVTHITVQKGTGAFAIGAGVNDKGWEPTWIVSYKGNGEARKLLAVTGKKFDQDAVLLMHRSAKRGEGDPAVELHFPGMVSHAQRKAISDVMRTEDLGGWTWGRRGSNTVVRAVSVPEWGSTAAEHLGKMDRVQAKLQRAGVTFKTRVQHVTTEVIAREDYDRVLQGE